LSRFNDWIVRSGMEFEMTGKSAGLPADVPVAIEDDGVLVLELSGLAGGFCPQPAATMTASAQAKTA